MAQTVKTETCSQRVREVTLSCWFWLDSDYIAGFRKLGGKTNQKISMVGPREGGALRKGIKMDLFIF